MVGPFERTIRRELGDAQGAVVEDRLERVALRLKFDIPAGEIVMEGLPVKSLF